MILPRTPHSPMPRRRALAGMLACAAMFGLAAPQAAARTGAAERGVKAAFLYQFLLYTRFPAAAFADAAAPLVIGLSGADELARELMRVVAGRSVQRRPLAVHTVREGDAGPRLHMLFVGGASTSGLERMLRALPPPLLVVTEAAGALAHGSVINFRIVDERVRFDVSLAAADKKQIKLSSRLLSVANHVSKGAP